MIAQASKRWSVKAISEGTAPLAIFVNGRPLTQTRPATVDGVSPVEFLLVSVATCFALSVKAVLLKRSLGHVNFEVTAAGEKIAPVTNRLTHIEVGARFGTGVDEAQAAGISADARVLCTVTNTLHGAPAIGYAAHTADGSHTRPSSS